MAEFRSSWRRDGGSAIWAGIRVTRPATRCGSDRTGKSPGRMTVRTPDVTEEALRRWVDPAISATDSQSKHGAIVGVCKASQRLQSHVLAERLTGPLGPRPVFAVGQRGLHPPTIPAVTPHNDLCCTARPGRDRWRSEHRQIWGVQDELCDCPRPLRWARCRRHGAGAPHWHG